MTACATSGEAVPNTVETGAEQLTQTEEKDEQSIFQQDAQELVETLEATHPVFFLDEISEKYEDAKKEYLAVSAQVTARDEFAIASQKYLASLNDGHTNVSGLVIVKTILDLPVVSDGERLFVEDEAGRATDIRIVEMGGVPVEKITAVFAEYFPIENKATKSRVDRYVMVADCLRLAGVETDGKTPLPVVLETNGQQETREVAWVIPEKRVEGPIVFWEQMGDVFYVDMNRCVVNEALDDTCTVLKEAVNSGVSKIIIDVRGNGGGNSKSGRLHAMGMEPPRFGSQTCISPLAKNTYPDFYGGMAGTPVQTTSPDCGTAKANPNIRLMVLTDEVTFSSATMMATFVQDGKLGQIVGRPSSYGDILYTKLSNTGLTCAISHKKWLRPDPDANQQMLEPDVLVPFGQDSLKTALAMMAQE